MGISSSPVRIRRKLTVGFLPWFVPNHEEKICATFQVLPKSVQWEPIFPPCDFSCSELSSPLQKPLADPFFWQSDRVGLIFSVELFAEIIAGFAHKLDTSLVSQESSFGHWIYGRIGEPDSRNVAEKKPLSVCFVDLTELDQQFQRFWAFEDLSLCTNENAEHEIVENMFQQSHFRDENGRFSIEIPLKPNITELGSSRQAALKRFLMLEKRFKRDPVFYEKYVEFMSEYEQLGHMIEAINPPAPDEMHYYIPHHGVISSTKFRVVFDGSCKTNLGISLNDAQFVGPKLQRDLSEIIMRFRRHKFAISGDIAKMYRQVKVAPKQWNLQRIFWRKNSNEPLKEYFLVVVTYGLASSPYIAVRAMIEGANDFQEQYPQAVSAIKNDFYMDDGTTGANTEQEAIQLAKDMRFVLRQSGFDLCKWRSNSSNLVRELEGEENVSVDFIEHTETSVLGLKWLTNSDEIVFIVRITPLEKMTKREILSKILQLYDPMGFISPVIAAAKILVQKLWQLKLEWDDIIPNEMAKIWTSIWKPIKELERIKIPRWLKYDEIVQVQVHGFADASVKAYGAVIYLRIVDSNEQIWCHLVASKSRIAPIKTVKIPRLELAAADLLSQLYENVQRSMELTKYPYFMWSDSTITLQWINKALHELKVFVGNRVKRISQYTEPQRWEHVRTHDNPADLISRGISANEIVDNSLWWHGPDWLRKPTELWPEPVDWRAIDHSSEMQVELKINVVSIAKHSLEVYVPEQEKCLPLLHYSENLSKLVNICAYVFRFVRNCRQKVLVKRVNKEQLTRLKISAALKEFIDKHVLLPSEIEKNGALIYFIKQEQALDFAKECAYFPDKENSQFPEKSKIVSLHPFMDDQGILRVGGRLGNADIPYDTKHPVIIPTGSRLSSLIIADAHMQTFHGATSKMIQYIRASYWIPRIRDQIRSYIHKCVTCARFAKKLENQLMANLPAERVNRNRPFLITGVDYAGPIEIVEQYKKSKRTNKRKCWIAIFVCMVTRAIHIDVVTDLSSAAFIACYERFIALRGHCNKMFSDNGTTFQGASKEIKAAFKNWIAPEVMVHLNRKRTEWVFMKPVAPHQGGIYEAAVKSAKFHLRRVLGAKCYTYEYLITFLWKVAAILNSRPLYALSDDPTDCQALTPGHFLIGEPFVQPPTIRLPSQSNYSLQRIHSEHQKMLESFWSRWQDEYLTTLAQRKKWHKENEHFQVGQLVVIKDDNRPPAQWLLGRIDELIISRDGLVRSVVIKTAKSKLTRAVQSICILPVMPSEQETNTER